MQTGRPVKQEYVYGAYSVIPGEQVLAILVGASFSPNNVLHHLTAAYAAGVVVYPEGGEIEPHTHEFPANWLVLLKLSSISKRPV